MTNTLSTVDLPPRPFGRGEGSTLVFQAAAEGAAARLDTQPITEEPAHSALPRPLTPLEVRLAAASGRAVRLGGYLVHRRIGAGGMGVVFEATSVEHGERVALKTLRRQGSADLRRFKAEFRSVVDVVHENLCSLYELGCDGGEWFFTMELLEGIRLAHHVARRGSRNRRESRRRLDETRLRAAFAALATGLATLHDAGRVHGDVNSANVIVTPEGRVVLLDFGLVTVPGDGLFATPSGVLQGTPEFMAPEQADLAPASVAGDWYGFGVVLFEALTGELPFTGSAVRVLHDKRTREAPRASTLVPGLAADLDELCAALLRQDPHQRPRGSDVLRALGASPARPRALAAPPDPSVLEEREAARARLVEAVAERAGRGPLLVRLEGPPGAGKTALLDALSRSLAASPLVPGAVVLRARCHELEAIPHRALDSLADALAVYLEDRDATFAADILGPDEGEGPSALRALSRLFALGDALERLARRAPLVVLLDGVEWADREGAALLAGTLARGAPIVLVAAGSPGATDELSAGVLAGGAPVVTIPIPVAGDGGSPARCPDHVARSLSALPPPARATARILAVAAVPLHPSIVLQVARTRARGLAALTHLRAAGLARTLGTGEVVVHDEPTAAALRAAFGAESVQRAHGEIARVLAARGAADPELVMSHFDAAGRPDEAVSVAARAAAEAAGQRRYDRAAQLLHAALARGVSRERDLSVELAEALASAGRPAEAAAAFDRAAEVAPSPVVARELRRRAAEERAVGGDLIRALPSLRAVLASHGVALPDRPSAALRGTLAGLARLALRGVELGPSILSPRPRRATGARGDACWSAAKALISVDPLRSGPLLLEALLLALDAADPGKAARALAFVGCGLVYVGGARRTAQGERLLDQAAALARRVGDPYLLGLSWCCTGLARLAEGRFADALGRCDDGVRLLESKGGGVLWEVHTHRVIELGALFFLGDLRSFVRRGGEWLAEAREKGDRFGEVEASLHLATGRLIAADAAGARALARRAIEGFYPDGFSVQAFRALVVEVLCDRLARDPAAAHRRLESAWPALEASQLLRVEPLRVDALALRAFTALGAAAEHRPRARAPRALLRLATRAEKTLARSRSPVARGAAALVRAGLAHARRDPSRAARELAAAAEIYVAAGMALHAACAHRSLGVLEGTASGRLLAERADRILRFEGVAEPADWAALMTGFRLPAPYLK